MRRRSITFSISNTVWHPSPREFSSKKNVYSSRKYITLKNGYTHLCITIFENSYVLWMLLIQRVDLVVDPNVLGLPSPFRYFLIFLGETKMRNMKRPLSKLRKLVMVTKICAAWLCERKTPRSMLTGSRLQVMPKTRKSLQYSSWTVCTKCFSQHKQSNACFLLNTLVAEVVSISHSFQLAWSWGLRVLFSI